MVRLGMLGALELEHSEGATAGAVVAQPKRVAVLAYLAAVTPRGFVRRDHLAALFWPESDSHHARSALRQAIHFLHGSLGKEALVSRGREEVGVDPDRIECDVWAFEQAIETGRHREALSLYRGPLLAGFHVTDAPEFTRWLDERREELRRAALDSARSWGHEALDCRRWAEAVEAFRGGLKWGPWDEDLVRGLIRALWGSGDRASALREYDAFAERLRADLDLEPSAETEDVLQELRDSGLNDNRNVSDRAEAASLASQSAAKSAAPVPPSAGAEAADRRGPRVRWPLPAGMAAAAVVLAIAIGRPGTADKAGSTPPRLAILPMESLSPDPDDRYLAAGLHEEILTHLQRIGGLQVIGETSVARYEGSEGTLADIADELEVEFVAQSALRREGSRVRVTAQLVEVRTQVQIWADTYDRPVSDVFAIQADVARSIAQALHVSAGTVDPSSRPATSPEAYLAFLEGLYHQRRSFREPYSRRAVERFRDAVRLDPGFTEAWARLVVAGLNLSRETGLTADRDSALAAWARLEELAPTAPQTRWARGIVLYRTDRFDEALAELEAARVVSPGDADVLRYLAAVHRALGRWEESREILLEALPLDPANPSALFEVGFAHRTTGRPEEAKRYGRLAVSLDPSVREHWDELVLASLWEGDTQGAHTVLDSAERHVGASALARRRAQTLRLEGHSDAALEHLLAHPPDGTSNGVWVASLFYAALAAGRSDLARQYADTLRAIAEHVRNGGAPHPDRLLPRIWLALAHAYSGEPETAVRLVETMPPVLHDLLRSQVQRDVAQVYVVSGRYGEAVDLLRHLLATSGDDVSVPMLRLDPMWDPLRSRADFQALLEEHSEGEEL